MDSALQTLLVSIFIYVIGAVVSLFFKKEEEASIKISGIAGIAAGLFGLVAALTILFGHTDLVTSTLDGPFAFTKLTLRMDLLSAFMVAVISLLAVVTSFYALSYTEEYLGRGAWAMGFFMNSFIASMVMLMVVDNAFYFIVFFEMMSLASYFLVISDQNDEAVNAGLLYFLIAHAGSILIMIAFFILFIQTGSLEFSAFRNATLSPALASTVFLLAFFGFGAKAGIIPLHGWLPRAHPAAPSHASAMMSGVMVKIGIFGIIKVGIDLLGSNQLWWGILVLGFGSVSSVLGVLYALAEHDIKRLLAYHTVENVGIILMGVGVSMIGMSMQTPAGQILAVLGLLAALYHLLNHAVFKGLLFLGAGAIIYKVHTKDMEKMGGLGKLMPYTAAAFLIGCMAISALPPLNGFVSEWYTYQSLFAMTVNPENSFIARLAGPIAIIMLAITGALAAMCFVKVYGISFCGAPRSEKASQATEVPWTMRGAMLVLAAICILLGVGANFIVPMITSIADQLTQTYQISVTTVQAGVLVAHDAQQAVLSPALVMILLVGMLTLPLIIVVATRSWRLPYRSNESPWACGYLYEERMAHNASSFTQPLRYMFSWLYKIRSTLSMRVGFEKTLQTTTQFARKAEPWWDEKILANIVRTLQVTGAKVQMLQHGDFRLYCLYIVAALVLLLITVSLIV